MKKLWFELRVQEFIETHMTLEGAKQSLENMRQGYPEFLAMPEDQKEEWKTLSKIAKIFKVEQTATEVN